MKLGDILENKSAGKNNPNKKVIFLREDSHYIHCFGCDGLTLRFYRNDQYKNKFLSVVGSLDLTKWFRVVDKPKAPPEEIHNILAKNWANTYVMSCYVTKEELYKDLRNDLKTLCEFITANCYL